jgi:hypothetical protein
MNMKEFQKMDVAINALMIGDIVIAASGKLSLVTGNGASIIDLGNLVTKPQEVAST